VRVGGAISVATLSPAVDWTIDQTIKFECTAIAGGTVTLNAFFIELIGSE
jgi:hypothetical protein